VPGALMLVHERFAVLTILLTAFGRAVSEVGAVMMVGGNIDGVTRVMTTAIALETSKGDLALALALGIVLLAVVGVIPARVLTGTPVSVVVFIGAIVLAGVVVNNAIVLVDTVNTLRAEGMERRAALAHGARMRLRPILITTLTTVLGLVPLALGIGEGAELQQPLAITVIAGTTTIVIACAIIAGTTTTTATIVTAVMVVAGMMTTIATTVAAITFNVGTLFEQNFKVF
jgi:hypothetical protein